MAVEVHVVTGGNNDKLKRTSRNMYTTREHWTEHVLFCVLPSFVLTDNKCILSCTVIYSK